MTRDCLTKSFALVALLCACATTLGAEPVAQFKAWDGSPQSFAKMNDEIAEFTELNLLNFPGAKLVVASEVDTPQSLLDGSAGAYGGAGRVAINGAPSRIVYYLGKPRKFSAIKIFSANIDERGNQDFEIRLANNAGHPGVEPKFPDAPTLSSGENVIGGNKGGYLTSYESPTGGAAYGTPL